MRERTGRAGWLSARFILRSLVPSGEVVDVQRPVFVEPEIAGIGAKVRSSIELARDDFDSVVFESFEEAASD
jgi:hypothetical protein